MSRPRTPAAATYVLQLPRYLMANADAKSVIPPVNKRMMDDGWTVAHVDSEEEMLKFAKRFAHAKYNQSASPVSRAKAEKPQRTQRAQRGDDGIF